MNSKPLRSVDPDGKELLIALRNGAPIFGINVNSFYWTPAGWVLMEFQKCVRYTPLRYDLNSCWYKVWRKYALLWKLARELRGSLYIVYYELQPTGGYGDFKVHRVTAVDVRDGMVLEDLHLRSFAQVRGWYNALSIATAEAFPFARRPLAWEPAS